MREAEVSREIEANDEQKARLAAMKREGLHLGETGTGLMIEDDDLVAHIESLAIQQRTSKREVVKRALEEMSEHLRKGDLA